jgi:hypothetical protein
LYTTDVYDSIDGVAVQRVKAIIAANDHATATPATAQTPMTKLAHSTVATLARGGAH